MNILVAGSPQILNRDDWLDQMNITHLDKGNAMAEEGIDSLCDAIDIKTLRYYRLTVVGRNACLVLGRYRR